MATAIISTTMKSPLAPALAVVGLFLFVCLIGYSICNAFV